MRSQLFSFIREKKIHFSRFTLSFFLLLMLLTIPQTAPAQTPKNIANEVDLSRFSRPPKPGVHPRVLISPEDLPEVRRRLKDTAAGRRAAKSIRAWLKTSIRTPNRGLHATYDALVNGKLDALEKAENAWWASNTSISLGLEAFDALIVEDVERGRDLAAALTTYAQISGGKVSPHGHKSVNPDYMMGMAYDFGYPFMNDVQRKVVRNVIAEATAGKQSFGMNLPPHRRNFNFISHGTQLLLMALTIEGEPGYDPSILPATYELMKGFLDHAIYPSGTPTEGMHYYNFGMSFASLAMTAMARRDKNLFQHPHYLATRMWYVNSIEPFGYAFSTHHDTPRDDGGLATNYVMLKWILPENRIIDYVWRNRVRDNYSGITYRGDFLAFALFPSDWTGGHREKNPKASQWGVDTDKQSRLNHSTNNPPLDPASLGLLNSYFAPERGLLITRSAWALDATALNFENRPDVTGPSHAHSDRNGFTLSALGRKWAIDRGHHRSETHLHSNILIDGVGQGHFGPAGEILDYSDKPDVTQITGDATYAYRYRYTFGTRLGNRENAGYEWEPEMLPRVIKYWSATQDPNDKPWITDRLYTHKAIENPVEYAYRTAALARGSQPYVIIVDDIRKDHQIRRYEWLMQLPDDLIAEKIAENHVVLVAEDADQNSPRLLVYVIDMSESQPISGKAEQAPIRVETFEMAQSEKLNTNKAWGEGKRLVLTSDSVEPRFKVLLMPYRPGDALPKIRSMQDGGFELAWRNQVDRWKTQRKGQGPTRLTLTRTSGR